MDLSKLTKRDKVKRMWKVDTDVADKIAAVARFTGLSAGEVINSLVREHLPNPPAKDA